MHPKVLSKQAWKLISQLAKQELLTDWTLVGGTGLALQFGHRYSEDLDLFRPEPFNPRSLLTDLSIIGKVNVQHRSHGTLHAVIKKVRLSFIQAQADFIFKGIPYRGLTVADPRDIAIMKVVAIGGRGSRKDFVDLYFLFRNGISLESIFSLLRKRFSKIDYNEYHLMKSLVFFEDAESEPMPKMIRQASWKEIKNTVIEEVHRLA